MMMCITFVVLSVTLVMIEFTFVWTTFDMHMTNTRLRSLLEECNFSKFKTSTDNDTSERLFTACIDKLTREQHSAWDVDLRAAEWAKQIGTYQAISSTILLFAIFILVWSESHERENTEKETEKEKEDSYHTIIDI